MRGGQREGSGRKRGFAAQNAEEARRFFSARVAEEIGPIAEALIDKAREGNIQAIKELFDRAWGRPLQSAKIEGAEPIVVQLVSYKDAGTVVVAS